MSYSLNNTELLLSPDDIPFQIARIDEDICIFTSTGYRYKTWWKPLFFTPSQKTYWQSDINKILDWFSHEIKRIEHVANGIIIYWHPTYELAHNLCMNSVCIYPLTAKNDCMYSYIIYSNTSNMK